ncbi:MAG TPA: DUF885 family protein, partial [Candidatus Binatia bacterium]|nr:DUF885 family protein [Candidatus Binatia bacterium]
MLHRDRGAGADDRHAPGRRPDRRPPDAAPGRHPVPEGRHPRAVRQVRSPSASLSGVHGRQCRPPPGGNGQRPDRGPDLGRADDRQLERLLAAPLEESPIPAMAQVATEEDREKVSDLVRDVVRPADAAFLDALRGDYLAATRTDPGLWSAPDGDRLYRFQARAWTTLDVDPEEVHRIGLEEMDSIEAERRAIAGAAGFGDDTAAYRSHIRSDPADSPKTKDEMLARAREDIDRALAIAPRYFGRLPKGRLEVR